MYYRPMRPRLDTPGPVHHLMVRLMVRHIEGVDIFRMGNDRNDFLVRWAEQCEAEALKVYAWGLIPNHVLC